MNAFISKAFQQGFSRDLKSAGINRNSYFTIDTSLAIKGFSDALGCWKGLEVWDMASSAIGSLAKGGNIELFRHQHLIDAKGLDNH